VQNKPILNDCVYINVQTVLCEAPAIPHRAVSSRFQQGNRLCTQDHIAQSTLKFLNPSTMKMLDAPYLTRIEGKSWETAYIDTPYHPLLVPSIASIKAKNKYSIKVDFPSPFHQ